MFDIALGIFLLLSPIFFLPVPVGNIAALQFYQFNYFGFSNANNQLLFFQFGVLTLFIIALFCKPQRVIKDKWLALSLALCLLSVFWHPKTVKIFPNIMLGFLLYYLVAMYTKNIKKIACAVLIVSALNTIFAILQSFGIHWFYKPSGRIDGLMCISSHLGMYQALAVPICYWLNPWFVIIPIIGLLLSKCLIANIAVSVAMIIYLRRKLARNMAGSVWVMFGLSISVISAILAWQYVIQKGFIRLTVWNETIKLIWQKLFLGYGAGTFKLMIPQLGQADNPYSLYLSIFFFFGIGGLLFLCFLKDRFTSMPKTAITASCLIALIIGLSQSFMDFPRIAGTVIVLFAFLTIEKGEKYGNDSIAI